MTAAHPFYSLTYGTWRYAGELEPNEALLCKNKSTHVLSNTTQSGTYTVYNIEVRQWHNYLVGSSGMVVHNNYADPNKTYTINGRQIINQKKAKNGVTSLTKGPFTISLNDWGFPDFTNHMPPKLGGKPIAIKFPLVSKDAQGDDIFTLKGNKTSTDFTKANNALQKALTSNPNHGLNVTFSGQNVDIDGKKYTWHHHEDSQTMMLVETKIHDTFRHTGSNSIIEHNTKAFKDSPDDVVFFPSPEIDAFNYEDLK